MARSRNILIIDGHPDINPQPFLHALAAGYARGALVGMVEGMSVKQRESWLQKLAKFGGECR